MAFVPDATFPDYVYQRITRGGKFEGKALRLAFFFFFFRALLPFAWCVIGKKAWCSD